MKEKLEKKHIGEILQRIYDSEIHIRIGWFWDGGVDFLEGAESFDIWENLDESIMRCTGEENMCKAFEIICKHLCVVYPKSSFTKWFTENF